MDNARMENARKVLIAVDGSDAALRAVVAARLLFGATAHYTLAHVAENVPMTPPLAAPAVVPSMNLGVGSAGGYAPATIAGERTAQELHEANVESAETIARRTAADAGLTEASVVGLTGDPAHALSERAIEIGADVIVVGSHGRGWLTRLFTSSVADAVRRTATVPVLVVPDVEASG